jgi:hypothetical protein
MSQLAPQSASARVSAAGLFGHRPSGASKRAQCRLRLWRAHSRKKGSGSRLDVLTKALVAQHLQFGHVRPDQSAKLTEGIERAVYTMVTKVIKLRKQAL